MMEQDVHDALGLETFYERDTVEPREKKTSKHTVILVT